ncbi:hypothetical protein [Nitrosomonas sp.]|uniref:hypothetical protein n=1 Tax=Nitrosomonas sp. TaxID=42353 RepID=UPI00272EF206|nr:hypothetical protein [Nitrosomonas sp.]MDP2225159.1 hypothetical protein [Nitrosomonas sp.]
MTECWRAYFPGGSWFFTVNLAKRKTSRLLVEKIGLLRNAFEYTKQRPPFSHRCRRYFAGSLTLYLDVTTGRCRYFQPDGIC